MQTINTVLVIDDHLEGTDTSQGDCEALMLCLNRDVRLFSTILMLGGILFVIWCFQTFLCTPPSRRIDNAQSIVSVEAG